MSDKIKITDVVPSYKGESDISEWWKRFEAVALIKKLTAADKAMLLPLLLRDSAFLIYDKMGDEDKADIVKVKERLYEAFSMSKFAAWEQLQTRRLEQGENVDAFYAELQRLSDLVGASNVAGVAFVVGLPTSVSQRLRIHRDAPDETLLRHARVLMEAEQSQDIVAVSAEKPTKSTKKKSGYRQEPSRPCFYCGEVGHYATNCPKRNKDGSDIRCGKCNEIGHFTYGCAKVTSAGNDKGVVAFVEPPTAPRK